MLHIDTYEFTRLGQSLGGKAPLAEFSRLLADLPPQEGSSVAIWSLRGEQNSAGQRFLLLTVRACPHVVCQRCLESFGWPIESDARLLLVDSEAELDDGLPEEDDEGFERILGSRRFDVMALLEDELVLSLPYVPKHDVCPSAAAQAGAGGEARRDGRPSPFAVLEKLKKD